MKRRIPRWERRGKTAKPEPKRDKGLRAALLHASVRRKRVFLLIAVLEWSLMLAAVVFGVDVLSRIPEICEPLMTWLNSYFLYWIAPLLAFCGCSVAARELSRRVTSKAVTRMLSVAVALGFVVTFLPIYLHVKTLPSSEMLLGQAGIQLIALWTGLVLVALSWREWNLIGSLLRLLVPVVAGLVVANLVCEELKQIAITTLIVAFCGVSIVFSIRAFSKRLHVGQALEAGLAILASPGLRLWWVVKNLPNRRRWGGEFGDDLQELTEN